MRVVLLTCAVLLLPGSGAAASRDSGAKAVLMAADGSSRGSVRVRQVEEGLQVRVIATGLPAGSHGLHFHGIGRCEGPDFSSAGPHWNPTERKHGRDNPEGAHHGDLPNLEIGNDGRGKLVFTAPAARLASLLDADGAALLIHAGPDDYRTDPSGNSGSRVACGIVTRE